MRKKWASRLLAMMLTGVTVVSMMPANIAHAEEADGQQGTTYYVSSQNGDDANDGTSEKKAFKTLDKINEITLGREIKYFWRRDLYLQISTFMYREAEVQKHR